MPLIVVGGGSRSGKSRHALELARSKGKRLGFIATAQAFDDEMRDRIRKHQHERSSEFMTFEEPFELARAITDAALRCDVIVVDCLTLWVSNLMLSDRPVDAESLVDAIRTTSAVVILVTNEVGCGIVPDNALARQFRDVAGWLNQRVAEAADEVFWMVFGIPMKAK